MSPRKKTPTKAELLQLQKLYKTDEKIGERLGGVPAYLVAYWRRKKGVPKHSLPKFSQKEIQNLWERFGDDDKCGLELGISKAAFYNWRRRYGIKEKPAFLKLEQLELNFPGLKLQAGSSSLYGEQTVAQKIIARIVDQEKVEIGQTLSIEPDLIVSHSNTGQVIEQFRRSGSEYVWNPNKIMIAPGTCPTENGANSAGTTKIVREFVKRQGIKNYFDISEGSCHQVAIEKGQVLPGQLVVGTDNYATSYGCLAAIATGIEIKQAASVWVDGRLEFKVPTTVRIDINGRRARGVYAKDIALSIMKQLAEVDIKGKAIEYYGRAVSHMSVSERFTLANLALDLGARAAVCPFDSTVRRYLTGRTMTAYSAVIADRDAVYEGLYQINIDHLAPQLLKSGKSPDVRPVADLEGMSVQLVVLGTCSNGRFDDLRIAADILKGRKLNPECRLLIYPGSRSIYLEALKKGLIRVFIEAGAIVMHPGCWQSLDEKSYLAPGERALATTNGAFGKAFNAIDAEVYLCSPATAATSALNGAITDPTRFVK